MSLVGTGWDTPRFGIGKPTEFSCTSRQLSMWVVCVFDTVLCVSNLCVGKILNDGQPLSDYKIQENSFVVVMVSRVKAKPPEVSFD